VSAATLRRGALALLAAATCIGHLGCLAPAAYSLDDPRLNPTLRRDRAPLSQAQGVFDPDRAGDPGALAYGGYRDDRTGLATPVVPDDVVPAANLVQSTCWWVGRHAGDVFAADAVRLHWEGALDLGGSAAGVFSDPDDGRLDLGACRINDPQTRQALRDAAGKAQGYASDCAAFRNVLPGTLAVREDSIPNCTEDTSLMLARLGAYAPRLDAFRSCTTAVETLPGGAPGPERWARERPAPGALPPAAPDNFSGAIEWVVDPANQVAAWVSACSDPGGFRVQPRTATRYRIDLLDRPVWIDPVLMVADAGHTLARPMRRLAPGDVVARWSTPVALRPGNVPGTVREPGEVRWEENFASRVRVERVRIFDLAGGQVRDLAGAPPRLCIEDPEVAPGQCRWTCKDGQPGDGRLEFRLAEVDACVEVPLDLPAVPTVTPTYAIPTALSAAAGSIDRPLEWRLELPPGGAPAPHIEFTLAIVGDAGGAGVGGASLWAERPALDFGPVSPFLRRRGDVTLRNLGARAARVLAVRIEAGPHAADFRAELPYAPEPIPLPLEVDLRKRSKVVVRPLAGMESQVLFRGVDYLAHIDYRPTDDDRLQMRLGETALAMRDGRWYRSGPQRLRQQRLAVAGVMQPVMRTSWSLRSVPFALAPGEAFDVSLLARPLAPGRRTARLLVDWEDALQPGVPRTVAVGLVATGLQGPLPTAAPTQVSIAAGVPGWTEGRSVLLFNQGDQPFDVSAARVTGVGGASTSLPFRVETPEGVPRTIGVGESTLLRVAYLGGCDAHSGGAAGRLAELRLDARSAGTTRTVVVALRGVTPACP
jgi:hypothetical protein